MFLKVNGGVHNIWKLTSAVGDFEIRQELENVPLTVPKNVYKKWEIYISQTWNYTILYGGCF